MSLADSPKKISRYELLDRLGEGGIGIVYKAMDPALQKIVAIKVLNAGKLTVEQQLRFQNEARALAELKHQSIPEIFNFSISEEGAPYMVMEFAEGKSLSTLIEQRKFLPVNSAIDVTIMVCEAIQHAHAMHILHRDIKPSNIIISDTGDLKVVDFGLAKFEKSIDTNQFQTKTGVVIGSPLYMSPEQFQSAKIDERSDIYSLGCVLFEMLSGEPPFVGQTVMETAGMHLETPPPVIPARVQCSPLVRDNLQTTINRCLAKKAEQRFKNMHELKSALEALTQDDNEATPANCDTVAQKQKSQFSWVWPAAAAVVVLSGSAAFMNHQSARAPVKPSTKATDLISEQKEINDLMFRTKEEAPLWKISKDKAVSINPELTDDDLESLAASKEHDQIAHVLIDQSNINGTGIQHLKGMHLHTLKISSPMFSEKTLDFLSMFPELEDLQLGEAEKVTVNGYKKIAQCRNLKNLKLANMRIPDGALHELSKSSSLQALFLRNELPVRFHLDLKPLALMRDLRFLEIHGFDFTSTGLHPLKGLQRLSSISLNSVDTSASSLEVLQSMPNLRTVELASCKITPLGLEKLERIQTLEELSISKCSTLSREQLRKFKVKHQVGRNCRRFKVKIDKQENNRIESEFTRDLANTIGKD